jgi:hypothetical protein
MHARRAAALVAVVGRTIMATAALALMLWPARGEAHKPITSPFTFNDDVLPIVRDRCGSCHAPGGVAPMSLLTHGDAVPWGESMRAELMAGHMPPWPVETAAGRFRNVQRLSARELNVLLTWASGGTPAGAAEKAIVPASVPPVWALGVPDAVLALPEVTLAADEQERVAEFTLPAGGTTRFVRAVDLLPGTPAIVRRATVAVKVPPVAGLAPERLLALWVPGDHPTPLEAGAAFEIPARSELVVRVTYRKTWEYERRVMTDRSRVGLYFAEAGSPLQALPLTASTTLDQPLQAVAIYPDPSFANAKVKVMVVRPGGAREELITFRPRPGWARRYWFREPIALPRGTRIEVTALDEEALLPPAASPAAVPSGPVRLVLNATRP